jgi:gamma-glutamyl hydrolase
LNHFQKSTLENGIVSEFILPIPVAYLFATTMIVLIFVLLYPVVFGSTRPIVGILSMPLSEYQYRDLDPTRIDDGGSYFSDPYPQWIYSAGARVVPIQYDIPADDLYTLLGSINGVLFTGGDLSLEFNTTYVQTAKRIFDEVIKFNDAGVHFPLWATCMGFQLVNALAADNYSVITHGIFDSEELDLPLHFQPGFMSSRMIRSVPMSTVFGLSKLPITANFHQDGIEPSAYFENEKLRSFFQVLSTNFDRKGNLFVSTVEAWNYPIYSTQWHPEKAEFNWDRPGEPHQPEAIVAAQSFADFFVSEAKKNDNAFPNVQIEQATLLYNNPGEFIGNNMVVHFFPPYNSTVLVQ